MVGAVFVLIMMLGAAIIGASWVTGLAARDLGTRHSPGSVTASVRDAGGAHVVQECFRGADGELYLFHKRAFLKVVPAGARFQQVISEACEAMELAADACDIVPMFVPIGKNAIAGVCDQDKVILIDRDAARFFGQFGWKFVILHEFGHHFCGHLEQFCGPEMELQADAFAGAGWRRLGFRLEDALSTLTVLGRPHSDAYPDIRARADAVFEGWMDPVTPLTCRLPRDP